MPIYEKPVWLLMRDMVQDIGLEKGKLITKNEVVAWFSQHYPKIKKGTITAHLIRMSTNAPSRLHYHGKPGDDDLFFQIDGNHFRLYDAEVDPLPIWTTSDGAEEDLLPSEEALSQAEFAYETDLQNFLAKNLDLLEPGMCVYQDDGLNGIEFPAGGRFIDILALDRQKNFVVIELKVSRGYDRTVGQLLRYMGWVSGNLAESSQSVRGFIVARKISEDLVLACTGLSNVELFEYELSVSVKKLK